MYQIDIEKLRKEMMLSKAEFCNMAGISRTTYYNALKQGGLSERIVYGNAELFLENIPDDYDRYTSMSLKATSQFYGIPPKMFKNLWGEEYTEEKIKGMMKGNQYLYYLKDLMDKTFPNIIVPCVFSHGKYRPTKAMTRQKVRLAKLEIQKKALAARSGEDD